jgi:hypothetical protein
MSPRSRTLVPAVLLLVSACGAPAASAPASVQPSVVAQSAQASAEAEAVELTRTGEALAPGRYTRAGFAPRITFEISDGEWYAEQLYTGFFDVQQEVGSPDVIAVQFAKPSEVYGEEGSSIRVETAEDAAAAVRGNPGLVVFGESESLIDGQSGIVVEVEHAGASTSNVGVMAVPPGPLSIAPERRLWIAFFDTDDGLLAIMVGGSVARWDEALAAAEPILETVTIGR